MEKLEKRRKKKMGCKRKKITTYETSSIVLLGNTDTIFPLLLATLCNHRNKPDSQSLVKKSLTKLLAFLFSKSRNPSLCPQPTLPVSILSLLPILLSSECAEIACLSAKIVGAASLLSFEMNERIASDGEIVRVLIWAVGSSSRRVSMAACSALLDLSTTSIGRQRLLEFSALQRLLSLCIVAHLFVFPIGTSVSKIHAPQICLPMLSKVPMSSIFMSLCIEDSRGAASLRIFFREDRQIVSILHAAISLINTCNIEQLGKVPRNLSKTFFVILKKLWAKVHEQMVLGNPLISIPKRHLCMSNITINNVAESIFRLSTTINEFAHLPSLLVKRRIFGCSKDSFETFMLRHWEKLPFHVRRPSTSLIEEDDIFNAFTESLNFKESSCAFLSRMLQSFISCLPIGSDELDILNFLEEVRNELGCPIIYQQDIRVLRTEKQSKREVHFFQKSLDPCIMTPHVFSIADIMKCEEAYKEGYTIALRGMEFRFASIAAVADTLASLFGQPSVGANLYLTPPSSQGLACHFDDHCVFVCQIFGNKQWTIFSQPNLQLPRLYDPLDSHSVAESSLADCRKFFLEEGDVLYVPRGFAHEACTNDSGSGELARFSLHITFGIEVEPPFEWGGFAHVALYHWSQNKKQHDHTLFDPLAGILNVIAVKLLHVMIELVGASDPTFRKACFVGALSLPLDTKDWLYFNQKTIFSYLVSKISMESRFLEALRILEVAIERKEDIQGIKWLQLLNNEKETIQGYDWTASFMEIENLYSIYVQYQDLAEAAFVHIKTKFCDEVSFEDVIDSYKMLFNKYRAARKQYMNGMLSLHRN